MGRKTALLIASAVALVLALPSAAAADYTWDVEGPIHLVGNLAYNASSPVTLGPCEVTYEGDADNVNGKAHAVIQGVTVSVPCVVQPLPGCYIDAIDFSNLPWTVEFSTNHSEVEVQNTTLTHTFNKTCQSMYGLPAKIDIAGNITGTFNAESQCIIFDNAGHLSIEVGLTPIEQNGEMCLTDDGPTLH